MSSGDPVPSGPRRAAWLAPGGRALRDLAANLGTGLALLALRPRAAADLRASGMQWLLLFLLQLAIGLGYDAYAVGWQGGEANPLALPALSFWVLAVLLCSALVGTMARDRGFFRALVTAGFALVCWESLFTVALATLADYIAWLDRAYSKVAWIPVVWFALAFGRFAIRLAPGLGTARKAGVLVLAAALLLAPRWVVNPASRLWVPAAEVEGAESAAGPDSPQSEETLYGQFDLLDEALDAIEPGQEGVTELFTITFAGDGTQDVFRSEAEGADAVLSEAFDSASHAIVLANNKARPQDRPFATVSALERALQTVADRMNGDEDILALFLTSHGSEDHHLVVSLPPYDFEDLTPERLRSMLDDAGIRYRIVIVSSCYSGGFIAPLAGPDTMVISASAADRPSFGCRDGAQWTDFGNAFFPEALAQTASFEGAFRIASARIAEREAREGLPASMPQISVGAGIREQLQRLETRRGGRILVARRAPLDSIP